MKEAGGLLTYIGKHDGKAVAAAGNRSRSPPAVQPATATPVCRPDRQRRLAASARRSCAASAETEQSPLTGLIGARTSLIPHQLYIAREVANRAAPRVLLADEVGLGKPSKPG